MRKQQYKQTSFSLFVVDSTVLFSFLAAPPLTLENVMSVVKGSEEVADTG